MYKAIRKLKAGKIMMNCLYIHKSAIHTLNGQDMKLYLNKLKYVTDFEYDIIKINYKTSVVSFVQSSDWDSSDEPTVGDMITVQADNTIRYNKSRNLIYHHKWMFVEDNYTGFDVEASKRRSEYWMNHPFILILKSNPKEYFNSKIGHKKYWETIICPILENNK